MHAAFKLHFFDSMTFHICPRRVRRRFSKRTKKASNRRMLDVSSYDSDAQPVPSRVSVLDDGASVSTSSPLPVALDNVSIKSSATLERHHDEDVPKVETDGSLEVHIRDSSKEIRLPRAPSHGTLTAPPKDDDANTLRSMASFKSCRSGLKPKDSLDTLRVVNKDEKTPESEDSGRRTSVEAHAQHLIAVIPPLEPSLGDTAPDEDVSGGSTQRHEACVTSATTQQRHVVFRSPCFDDPIEVNIPTKAWSDSATLPAASQANLEESQAEYFGENADEQRHVSSSSHYGSSVGAARSSSGENQDVSDAQRQLNGTAPPKQSIDDDNVEKMVGESSGDQQKSDDPDSDRLTLKSMKISQHLRCASMTSYGSRRCSQIHETASVSGAANPHLRTTLTCCSG